MYGFDENWSSPIYDLVEKRIGEKGKVIILAKTGNCPS